MAMSSLVQRQPERQGIFLIALSPLERGAGGVKYLPFFFTSPSEGQEERKQSGELFSDDWGRTVNLRPSDSDGSKCYSYC